MYQSFLIIVGIIINCTLFASVYLTPPEDFKPRGEAVGCFIEYQDHILLLHRQDSEIHGGLWCTPGGKFKKGESLIEATVRETFEETGYTINPEQITYLEKLYIRFPQADFICHLVRIPCPDHPAHVHVDYIEHKGFTWVTPEEALKMPLMLNQDVCLKRLIDHLK